MALLAGGCWVAIDDPAAPGSHLPGCAFHATTGWWCPGCGLTRATHLLVRGDVAGALSSNALVIVALGAIVLGWSSWALRAWGGRRPSFVERHPPWVGSVLVGITVALGVLRNVPWTPLRSLAP